MTKKEMIRYRLRREKILALHAQGVSHPAIAKRFGLKNRQRVWQIVNRR